MTAPSNRIRRVLFVAEAVTLAQVVRLLTLARSLPKDRFEVHFASARFDERLFGGTTFRRWPIASLSPRQVERAVAWGLRIYDRRTLSRYVDDDLRVLDRVEPDVVVGDLRWSLAVSGPLRGVKVVSLANAYWSPFVARDGFPLPEHPVVRLLGVDVARQHFPRALPAVFRHFAAPLNRLREQHGLAPIGSLPDVITWGDVTLYADPPALFTVRGLPRSHRFIGPVQWAPDVPFAAPSSSRPLVYVTMGSSGRVETAPIVLEALASLDVDVLLATAGRFVPALPPNARAVDFVRGDLAARAAAVVVSNGGSTTGYQALAEGTPVVGLPFNLDQYLAMSAIEAAGAGVLVRSGTATPALVRDAVLRAMKLRDRAQALAPKLRELDPREQFLRAIEE